MAYWKIYLAQNTVCIVQLGECDELDYNASMFLSNERFDTDEQAVEYLRANEDKLPRGVYNPYTERNQNVLDM